jgi:hypothetical protein
MECPSTRGAICRFNSAFDGGTFAAEIPSIPPLNTLDDADAPDVLTVAQSAYPEESIIPLSM